MHSSAEFFIPEKKETTLLGNAFCKVCVFKVNILNTVLFFILTSNYPYFKHFGAPDGPHLSQYFMRQ